MRVDKLEGTLKKMKSGKTAGVDGVVVEMLKGSKSMIEWLAKLCTSVRICDCKLPSFKWEKAFDIIKKF